MPLSPSHGCVLPGWQGLGDPPLAPAMGTALVGARDGAMEVGRGCWSRGENDGAGEGAMEVGREQSSRGGGGDGAGEGGNGAREGLMELGRG